MHECLLCKRDMKTSKDTFGNGCVRNIYSLYNLAHCSVNFGVMKEYDIDIKFKMNDDFEVIDI